MLWTKQGWKHEVPRAFQGQLAQDWAILPGFVNAHSHAFQHAMRGHTEFSDARDDDFWSWRNAMYNLALTMEPDAIYAVAKKAYDEMVRAGITRVGEFHYVHHDPRGVRYADDNELAHQVIRAAKDAGLKITLLLVAYHRAGFGRPALDSQRRFVEPDVDTYLERVERLLKTYASQDSVSIGVAPHSIRAVPREWLEEIAKFAALKELPFHIHANEQVREIEESKAEYGQAPICVFEDLGVFEAKATLVHATHLSEDELDILQRRKPIVCACPTTERNLGDGFLEAKEMLARSVPIAIGSDSHAQIDFLEEIRCVEYHERLRFQQRNVLAKVRAEETSNAVQTGDVLLEMTGLNGRDSLMVSDDEDFVAFDLNHPSLHGWNPESLSSHLALAGRIDAVAATVVSGRVIHVRA